MNAVNGKFVNNQLNKILPKKKRNYLKQKQLIKHCCFDLDGTLVDSNKTIYNSTAYALGKLGIDFNVAEDLFALKIGQLSQTMMSQKDARVRVSVYILFYNCLS